MMWSSLREILCQSSQEALTSPYGFHRFTENTFFNVFDRLYDGGDVGLLATQEPVLGPSLK